MLYVLKVDSYMAIENETVTQTYSRMTYILKTFKTAFPFKVI